MRVTGIIAEYNPFHNGHLYQIEEIKKRTDSDYIIVAMSGDFMQRGIPGILNKWERAKLALAAGADLVLELPSLFATASAESFAAGGVSLLDKTGVVTDLCFGAETDDLPALLSLADYLCEEPEAYKNALRQQLKQGKSFPAARSAALLSCIKDKHIEENETSLKELLSSSNNILALEYLKSLKRRNSSIHPFLLKREGSGYNDAALSSTFSSATSIRKALLEPTNSTSQNTALSAALPEHCLTRLLAGAKNKELIYPEDLSSLLYFKLLQEKETGFVQYLDVSRELSDKITKAIIHYSTFPELAEDLKTKELTLTRIYRALLHILLGIKEEDLNLAKEKDFTPYLRVLGFKKESTALLGAIKKNASVPLVTKLADAKDILDEEDYALLQKDVFASDVYRTVLSSKSGLSYKNEFEQSPIRY